MLLDDLKILVPSQILLPTCFLQIPISNFPKQTSTEPIYMCSLLLLIKFPHAFPGRFENHCLSRIA